MASAIYANLFDVIMDRRGVEVAGIDTWLMLVVWSVSFLSLYVASAIASEAIAHPSEYPFSLGRLGTSIFISFQILAALITYLVKFDPTGTYKPAWTNQLG